MGSYKLCGSKLTVFLFLLYVSSAGLFPNINLETANDGILIINGLSAGGHIGFSVDSLGDVNFDGWADYVVAAEGACGMWYTEISIPQM